MTPLMRLALIAIIVAAGALTYAVTASDGEGSWSQTTIYQEISNATPIREVMVIHVTNVPTTTQTPWPTPTLGPTMTPTLHPVSGNDPDVRGWSREGVD